ncbi:hypothetical protein GXP71_16290 [Cellulomonas sp. H30R-01]|uniref:hypothetical protein n=1 Tax=Cellulomonas sp. H30R-01 TaxID=2704467 RepID=UPI00138CE603|nr:hypothetical protein [Cellulomonas sp. H30R-01]QHT57476.1 hypothetical protein GXP71_16290 [Cellulomonas sp. H30R-01]
MASPLTAPTALELAELGLDAQVGDEPWVRTVTFDAAGVASVELTWDEIAGSVHVVWSDAAGTVIVEITRESVDTVSVSSHHDGFLVAIACSSEQLGGALTVSVTSTGVQIKDTLLRR